MEFKDLKIIENKRYKICKSSDYNFIFNKDTGFFARWGKNKDEDPEYGPSPEILDLEISSGKCRGKCKFCYKGNGKDENTHHMTFEEFKTIFEKINKNKLITQIAFGICDINSNKDFFKMMEYSREHGVIPNYTCHGLDVTKEVAKKTAELCGAVAVSIVNKEKTYDAIKLFTDEGMKQVNCHYVLSMESYDRAFEIIDDISTDPRLEKFNAIVFLQYKDKNKNSDYHSVLDVEKYKKLINYCNKKKVNYGFDSCSAPMFIESIKDDPNNSYLETMADPCESFLFSLYISCKGKVFPCSFGEDIEEEIDVLNCNNFVKDVWNNEVAKSWRKKLIDNERNCPVYELSLVKN